MFIRKIAYIMSLQGSYLLILFPYLTLQAYILVFAIF